MIFTLSITYSIVTFGQLSLQERVEHSYVNNEGVKIHYIIIGSGDPVLFVHGFPDFWYGWRDQIESLHEEYKVAAVDLRGYNLSDGPLGVENYRYDALVKDLLAVIEDFSEKPINLVAHDWGAAISWRLAIAHPELIKKLVIVSVPHPRAGDIVLEEDKTSEPTYVDRFVSDEFMNQLTENWLSGWVTDKDAKPTYLKVFSKANKQAMINYYKANHGTIENLKNEDFLSRRNAPLKNLQMPVLIVHGKNDPFLTVSGHNNTWDFIDNDLTIKILADAGHFVQQDASEELSKLIIDFIKEND